MVLPPSRLGFGFALTLLLPAAFAGVWAWLQHGGAIARAVANERAAAEQALAAARLDFDEALRKAAADCSFPLQLDGDQRVVGPFANDAAPPAEIGIAEQAAGQRLALGDTAAASAFFAHAAEANELSPEGVLRYSDLVAAGDLAAARRMLAAAVAREGERRCGSVPFALLAALQEARWLQRANGSEGQRQQQLAEVVLEHARRLPAEAVPVFTADAGHVLPPLRDDPRLAALRTAAAAAAALREVAAPDAPAPAPGGGALVPFGDGRLAALPAATVQQLADAAIARAAAAWPSVAVQPAVQPAGDNAPTASLPALGIAWTAVPVGTPSSALLAFTADTCLGLAIVTFVLGNLLLIRLVRREVALVRLRADFVDVVSHELRTPLAALSLKAEMLASGDVPAARSAHYLQSLRADVRRLAEQVERILDFDRLEKGAPLHRERLAARTLLARGVREGRPALRLVGQALEVEAPRALPPLLGDVEVLGRALRNLLENAAKYAPPGSTVSVRAFAHARELCVEVADRGPGVAAGERASIFQPFVRGRGGADGTPGSGLGLALVAAAARAHGGRVEVGDRQGGGAVFRLTLPLARGEAAS